MIQNEKDKNLPPYMIQLLGLTMTYEPKQNVCVVMRVSRNFEF